MARNNFLKALVCVEHEQHDHIQDTALASRFKTTFIVNGFDVGNFRLENPPEKQNNLVVYLGALVPQKGFMCWRGYGRKSSNIDQMPN